MPSGSWAKREWYPRFAGRSERHCAVAEQAVQLAQPATWIVAAEHTGTRTIANGTLSTPAGATAQHHPCAVAGDYSVHTAMGRKQTNKPVSRQYVPGSLL
jgi:hypothetical protein